MLNNEYTSIEEAQQAFDAVPSYVQRYANDPFLYSQEEEVDAFTLVVVVDITDIYTDADHVAAEAVQRG